MNLRWLVVGALLVSACGGGSSTPGTDGGAGTGGGGGSGGSTGSAGTGGGAGTTGSAGSSGGAGTTGTAGSGGGAGTGGGAGADGGVPDAASDGGQPVGPFTCTPATHELVPEAGATGARLCFHASYTGGGNTPPVFTGYSCTLQTAACAATAQSTAFQLLGFDLRTGMGYARTATNDPVTRIRTASAGAVTNEVTYYQVAGLPLDTDVTIVVPPSPYWTAGYGTDEYTIKARFVGTTVTGVVVARTPPPAATDAGGQ